MDVIRCKLIDLMNINDESLKSKPLYFLLAVLLQRHNLLLSSQKLSLAVILQNSLLLREVVLELESLSSDDSSSNKGFSIPRICSLIINAPCIFLGQLDENDYQLKVLSTLADELLTDAPIISTILLCKSCILGWKNLPVFLRTNGAKLSLVCDILVKGTYAGSHISELMCFIDPNPRLFHNYLNFNLLSIVVLVYLA
ncbi:hypothetical protein GJ496_011252 [Pomphorhynchus laevis]|nr:hypothetical protein GJ496_011252 [Pomphorhynchus laevis]